MDEGKVVKGAPFDEAPTQGSGSTLPQSISENVTPEQTGAPTATNSENATVEPEANEQPEAPELLENKEQEPASELISESESLPSVYPEESIPETATAPEPVES